MLTTLSSVKIIWMNAKIPASLKILQYIFISVLTPLSILFTQNLINSIEVFVGGIGSRDHIVLYLSLLIISMLFISGNSFFDEILNIELRKSINKNLTFVIINKFCAVDYPCFEDSEIADTMQRMGDTPHDKILNVFLESLNTFAVLVSILGTAIIFMQVSLWFSLSFVAILAPMLWLDFKAVNMMNTMFNLQSEQERKLDYFSDLLGDKHTLLELKVFNATEYILDKWRGINKKVLDERLKTTILSQKYFAISTVLTILWVANVIFSLIQAIGVASISIGTFIVLIGAAGTVLTQSQTLSRCFSSLSQQSLEVKHYHKFMDLPEINSIAEKHSLIGQPRIAFEDVHFAYPQTGKQILNGVSFEVLPNQKVALVGENGAGKSTIIKLLCKLYKPDKGKITINGVDLNDISYSQLSKVISVVFQEYFNYSLTIRENVALSSIDRLYEDESIMDTINKSLGVGAVNKFKSGLNTSLGKIEDDSVDLSGGEWQKIAIARALFSESDFVVLDEPTAALDPIAENDLYNSFIQVLNKKGCVIISHRLASARLADNIIVFKDGRVEEQGEHSFLMDRKGLYYSMFTSQSAWYRQLS